MLRDCWKHSWAECRCPPCTHAVTGITPKRGSEHSDSAHGPVVPPPYPPWAIVIVCKLLHSIGEFPQTPRSATNMLELNPRRTANPQAANATGTQQSRRLLLALVLLVGALAVILIKDRDFWFGSEPSTVASDMPETASAQPMAQSTFKNASAAHASKKQIAPAARTSESQPVQAPAVQATRTVLPPLDIEVVAGNTHKKLHPGSNATKLEITDSAADSERALEPPTNAAEREPIVDSQPVYPLLAQHMNVQGSVVLQALIGTDGVVENLRVMSGPAILAAAAQQAVREWRFKPILQNGQAVESKALITVNFTIKVAGSEAKTTLADSRASDALVITR